MIKNKLSKRGDRQSSKSLKRMVAKETGFVQNPISFSRKTLGEETCRT